jgi:DNA-binding transcriptional regulator GbsR (MarR family)
VSAERDEAAVGRFVEQFAEHLVVAGMSRMPSRVFAQLLASDSGRMTAAELAEALQVSPAAVSGAVRYLIQVGMISRERLPGTRREVYAIYRDSWYEMMASRDQLLARWVASLADGVVALGRGTPAGERLAETQEFIEFLAKELSGILARWRERHP